MRRTTPSGRRALTPSHSTVKDGSVLAVQIFDQKKFKKRDQGFLGVINVPVAQVIDLELGGKGAQSRSACCMAQC